MLFTGYRTGAYIVKLNWQTKPEINVKKFVVERRRANEPAFYSLDTVASQAPNGYSTGYLNYALDDSNSYNGITFYRLKIFDYNDSSYYAPIIGVRGVAFSRIGLWPNPTADRFTVLVDGHIAQRIVIYNSLGQLVSQEDVNGRNVVELRGYQLASGVYFVSALGKEGKVLSTEKLVIQR